MKPDRQLGIKLERRNGKTRFAYYKLTAAFMAHPPGSSPYIGLERSAKIAITDCWLFQNHLASLVHFDCASMIAIEYDHVRLRQPVLVLGASKGELLPHCFGVLSL